MIASQFNFIIVLINTTSNIQHAVFILLTITNYICILPSMQFVPVASFKQPYTEQKKTSYMSSTAKKNKNEKNNKIVCAVFNENMQILTCGLADGSIIQFVNQKFNNKVQILCDNSQRLIQANDYQVRKFDQLQNIHKGEITCILAEHIFNQVFIITGSADRTIKIWDTQPKSRSIVQTISGHAGTITCLVFSAKSDTIFSGSVDKSVRIWKQDEGRKFFMYPWYVNYQVISEFCPKKSIDKPLYPTTFELIDGQINNFILYMGDSSGNLHIIKQYELSGFMQQPSTSTMSGIPKFKTAFEVDRSNYKHHRLQINKILYIQKQHLVVSIGFDQCLYGFQSLSEKLTIKYNNPKKCLFTSLVSINNLLVVSDQSGMFYYLQLGSDKGIEEVKKYDTKIWQIFTVHKNQRGGGGQIFVVTEDAVDVYRVFKGIKTVEGDNCHTDSIIGIYSQQAYKLTNKKVRDQAKIISVSLDNTLRVWDPTDLSCLQVMKNTEKAQISSLFYLKRANLFVTGHENGMVRLWNIQLQTSITISQQNLSFAHKNNVCSFGQYIHVRGSEDITQFMFSTGYEGKVNVWQIFLKKSSVQTSLISSSISPQLKNSFFPDQSQQSSDKIGYELFSIQIWQNKLSSEQQSVTILTAGTKGYVYFTKMFTYETYHKQKLHEDSINCMLIDENILFTGSCDHTIKLTNLQNLETLTVLYGHETTISALQIIQETGHLVSHGSDGEILFWNYIEQKIVKKIKQKKETINCTCYIDQSHIMYVGTQEAKILTYDISNLYQQPVNKAFTFKNKQKDDQDLISEDSLQNMLKKNQEQLAKLMKQM